MAVQEFSHKTKSKKLKLDKNKSMDTKSKKKKKISCIVPTEEAMSASSSEPTKKPKKARVTDGGGVTETDTAIEPIERKSDKKRKRNLEVASTDEVIEQSESDAVSQKPGKKRKKQRAESTGDTENAAISDIATDATEESAKAPSPEKKVPRSKKGENPVKPKDPEQEKRTVFVGNLPVKTHRRELRKFFMQFGKVDSVRLRSAPRLDAKKPIRMAVITHRFSEDRSSLNAYVRYVDQEGAKKAAAEANGQLFMEHRLRVDPALAESRPDPRLAVFIGGLPLNAEDDQLWTRFAECGDIVSVRIIRDRQTSIGKGIGYVNFADEEAVPRALKLNGSELEGRTIRVQRCHATAHSKVDRLTGKKLRKARLEGGSGGEKSRDNKLAPVNKFSGDATAESKSSLKKKKGGKKKERWDDAKRQKRNLAQSLSKTIAPVAKPAASPVFSIGGVTLQNKKIKFDFGEEDESPSEKKKDSEKLKQIKLKKEAKRKKKAKESEAKMKKNIVEPLTNILPSQV